MVDFTRGAGDPTEGISTVGASAGLTAVTSTPQREQNSAPGATGVPQFWQRVSVATG
jgi:hypothetical protein